MEASSSGWWARVTGGRPWLDVLGKAAAVGLVSSLFPDDDLRHRIAFAVLVTGTYGGVLYLTGRPLRRERELLAFGTFVALVLAMLFVGGWNATDARTAASGVGLALVLAGILLWTSRSTLTKLERALVRDAYERGVPMIDDPDLADQ